MPNDHTSSVHQSVARAVVPTSQQQGLSPDQIVKAAMKQVGKSNFENYCQKFVEQSAGVNDRASSAKQAYNNAVAGKYLQSGTNAPAGAQLFFTGNPRYGHTAVSVGGGYMVSTGVNGKAQKMKISDLQKSWGTRGTYLGYSTRIGGQNLAGSPQFKDLSGSAGGYTPGSVGTKPEKPTVASPSTLAASTPPQAPSTGNVVNRIY